MNNHFQRFCSALIRRKPIHLDSVSSTRLHRCLSTFDLTALGVGSTLGLGVYVLAGQVAVSAGPSVILSFVIAAVASVFAGLCYAEFAARVPKAGSAYVYSYTTVGEFIAFLIGWNLILEYVIGTASVAKGFSEYSDSLFNNAIEDLLIKYFPINYSTFSPYFDFFAFSITMTVTVLLVFGIKESTNLTTVFTGINLYVVLFVMICGSFKVQKFKNWFLPAYDGNEGGFFPYGFKGMIAGASRCFYGFVGFDAIASTGEEAKNPQKSMPIAIVLSLSLILAAYFGVAAVSTLMWPYYDQKGKAPLADVFQKVGWPVARYVIAVGATTSLTTALLGSLLPLPRILYAMASDGLLPAAFKSVNKRTKTPIFSTIISGLFAGFMSAIFTLNELTDMMSIGTLLAYTLVTLSVLILRYQEDHRQVGGQIDYSEINENEPLIESRNKCCYYGDHPSPSSSKMANILIALICTTLVIFASLLHFCQDLIFKSYAVTSSLIISLIFAIILTFLLYLQPQTKVKLPFKVPFLPFFPVISIFFNIYLMLNLTVITWYRFIVWIILGFIVYFGYGYFNSVGYLDEKAIGEEDELDSDKPEDSSTESKQNVVNQTDEEKQKNS